MRTVSVAFALVSVACSLHDRHIASQPAPQAEQEVLQAEARLAEALNALDDTVLF